MFVPENWRRPEPFSYMDKGSCSLCGVVIATDNETEARVALINHVGRAHPAAYEATIGHAPTDDRLRRQTYLLREGVDPGA